MAFYFPHLFFDSAYSDNDRYMIATAFNKVTFQYRMQMQNLAGWKEDVFRDLRVEFVSERNKELRDAGAIGIAYKDRNVNTMPAGLAEKWKKNDFMGKTTFTAYSGVFAMELAHSLVWRLLVKKALVTCNDVIHWLYNEDRLSVYDYVTQHNFKYFGASLKMIIPQVGYAWENREEIMEGIKSGKYKEGKDKYWVDGNNINSRVLADRHELEHCKNFVVFGSVKGESSYVR